MSKGHQLGVWGESQAQSFLEMCGYTCLEQRYRRQCGEIDLIVRRGNTIAFVEVKARGPRSVASPEAWVTRQKLTRMKQTARHWLADNRPSGPCNFRFDVIAIEFNGEDNGLVLRHLAGVL